MVRVQQCAAATGMLRASEQGLTFQTRLYSKGRILGHRRSKHLSHPNVSLIKIEGVENAKDAQFYLGKVRVPLLTLAHCLHLQGPYGGARQQVPCDLGPCYPDTRRQRCGALQVPPQHPSGGFRCLGPCAAVPQQQYVSSYSP